MPDAELSLIKFGVINFFSVILNSRPMQPISTLLIKLVEALIHSEPTPDKENLQRIRWIYENTHKKVEISLSVVELVVFKNLDKGLNKEVDIGDKTFYLIELYKYLDEVAKELTNIVIGVAKKYNLDIPVNFMGTQQSVKISLEDDGK